MKKTLLAMSAAALLAGTTATWAQGLPGSEAGPNATHPTEQHPNVKPDEGGAGPGATAPDQKGPQGPSEDQMRRDDDRNGAYQHTQLQGDDRDRDQMQGGQMLRGGDVRSPDSSRLTIQEKTNLRETVLRSGPRATNINFRIGVGVAVPRSVRLVAVPQPILAVYPEWSGDLYFDYGNEIVVVAPSTLQIVGVLPL